MMKATYKNIPTWYKEGTFTKNNKEKLIKEYGLENKKNVNFKAYFLSEKLTEKEEKELLKKYNNIDITYTFYEYVPEIKNNVIIICTHKLRGAINE